MDPQVLLSQQGGVTVVRLEGRAGVQVAGQLRQLLLEANFTGPLLVDWDQAEHVESCVLQVLLTQRPVPNGRERSLLVCADNPRIRQYLQLSGLSDYFPASEKPGEGEQGETTDA